MHHFHLQLLFLGEILESDNDFGLTAMQRVIVETERIEHEK